MLAMPVIAVLNLEAHGHPRWRRLERRSRVALRFDQQPSRGGPIFDQTI